MPFLFVGIVVICAFGVISYYNGYTIQRRGQVETAKLIFDELNRDVDYLNGRLSEQEIREKYRYYGGGTMRITDASGHLVTYPGYDSSEFQVLLRSEQSNSLGWTLEFLIDEKAFAEQILESQNYVVVAAIAALMIIIQASIFIAHSITRPIRDMGKTCLEINANKGSYRSYHFDSVRRRDEIGQLAVTFESLLRNMDNYTKMEYTSRMSATLAHEIKNPIAGIRSGIQLLEGRVEKESEKMLCSSMIREIDRVNTLIMNLFTLSVKKESAKTKVALDRVIREITMIYARGAEGQGVTLQCDVEEGLTGWLNENEFRQIAHNLINNSIKATKAGQEGRIRISGRTEGKRVTLLFEDNGTGMTPEELSQAMEPFYTKSINGVGLGLAIVKKLVEQNMGTLKMESRDGEGTSVCLTFFRKEGDYEEGFDR